jgi:cation diffusion facilitator CzcD-associated flavoprotein CzcO
MKVSEPAAETQGLAALEARLRQDLAWLELPAKAWVPPQFIDGQRMRDVVIIGGGMAGLAASAMLKRLGVQNHVVYDQAPAGREGPWVSYARMQTLRSPKQLTGPAMGLPALTFRAFYEAQFGRAAWDALGKVPRAMWMDYLVWYRKVLELPIENDSTVTAIRARPGDVLELTLARAGGRETVFARRVVLATGRDGLGSTSVPDVAHRLDPRLWAHSAVAIDFSALAGKRVGVIGAGASAMDNAATALEEGAARLDLFIRRPDIPRVNKFTGIGSQGVVHGFAGLPDEWKWRFLDHTLAAQTPPPRDSTLRVSRHANAHFHLGSPMTDIAQVHDHLVVTTPKGRYAIDFMIFATGFGVDLARRPELHEFAPHIRFWGDRFAPPDGLANGELAASPDLGESFEFLERTRGACPALKNIHCFNFPATLSHGKLTGDIPAISEGADRLARGIVRSLFVEDREIHFENLKAYATPELLGDEWVDADAPGMSSHAAE